MAVYHYKALDKRGKLREGTVEGETPQQAREKVRALRYNVVEVRLLQAEEMAGGHWRGRFRPSRLDITQFTRQLATLLRSGIPLAEALKALIEQEKSPAMEAVLRDLRDRIQRGNSLAEAMEPHSNIFSELYINMVKAGEAAGTLPEILERLGHYYNRQKQLRGKVSAALAYPTVMMVVGTAVVIFLMTAVVPRIVKIILKRGGTLPLPTKILMGVSSLIKNFWPLLLALGVGVFFLLRMFFRTRRGKYLLDKTLLHLPILGDVFRKQAIARFSLTYSTLLRSGLSATESLLIVKKIVGNRVLEEVLEELYEAIQEGSSIAAPLRKSAIFPPTVGYMIAIGEESGQLEEMLERIAESYSEEIDLATQKLTSVLEPVIIVVMAVVVGFIVMAVILPMVQGFQNIR